MERALLGNATELIHCQFVPVPAAHHTTAAAAAVEDDVTNTGQTSVAYERVLVLRGDADCTLVEMSTKRTSASFLRGHADHAVCADVTVDGCWIVTGAKDQTVRVWNARLEHPVAIVYARYFVLIENACRSKALQCTCLSEGPGTTTHALPVVPSAGGMFVVSVCLESVLKVWTVDRNPLRAACQSDADTRAAARSDPTIPVDSATRPEQSSSSVLVEINESLASVVAHDKGTNAVAVAPNDKVRQNIKPVCADVHVACCNGKFG